MTNPVPTPAEMLSPEQIEALRKAGREFAAASARLTAAFQAFGEGVSASLASQPAADLDVERVKQAVVNIAKRHGLAERQP